jgi:hypothetical protein
MDHARAWWVDTLGLTVVQDSSAGLMLEAGQGTRVLLYVSPGAGVAPNSVLDFAVDDIDDAVDSLVLQGLTFERYDGLEADERGIADMGPMRCAWLSDPDGNSIAISQLVTVAS